MRMEQPALFLVEVDEKLKSKFNLISEQHSLKYLSSFIIGYLFSQRGHKNITDLDTILDDIFSLLEQKNKQKWTFSKFILSLEQLVELHQKDLQFSEQKKQITLKQQAAPLHKSLTSSQRLPAPSILVQSLEEEFLKVSQFIQNEQIKGDKDLCAFMEFQESNGSQNSLSLDCFTRPSLSQADQNSIPISASVGCSLRKSMTSIKSRPSSPMQEIREEESEEDMKGIEEVYYSFPSTNWRKKPKARGNLLTQTTLFNDFSNQTNRNQQIKIDRRDLEYEQLFNQLNASPLTQSIVFSTNQLQFSQS